MCPALGNHSVTAVTAVANSRGPSPRSCPASNPQELFVIGDCAATSHLLLPTTPWGWEVDSGTYLWHTTVWALRGSRACTSLLLADRGTKCLGCLWPSHTVPNLAYAARRRAVLFAALPSASLNPKCYPTTHLTVVSSNVTSACRPADPYNVLALSGLSGLQGKYPVC
jgi:hypothetical protein